MTPATLKSRTRTPVREKLERASPATVSTGTATAIPPSDTQLELSPGSKVEVKIDEEGLRGAWYGATVVQVSPSRKRKAADSTPSTRYLVEYDSLLARGDNSSKPLKEFADVSSIRPAPPADDRGRGLFKLHDVVDAFHRDGWFTGVVTRVGYGGKSFTVYFQDPPEEKEFNRPKLRLHRDWVDGKWNLWKPGAEIQVGKQNKVAVIDNEEQSQVDASRNGAEEDGQLQCTPVLVVGLTSIKENDAHASNRKEKESVKFLDGEKHLNGAESLHNSKQDIAEPESGVSSQKEKRGRPANSLIKGHADTEKNGTETALTEVVIKDNLDTEAVRLLKTGSTSQGRKKQKSVIKGHKENNGAEAALTEVIVKDNPEIEAVRLSKTGSTSRGRKKQKSMIKGYADTENNGAEAASAEVLMNDNPEIEAVSLSKTDSTSRGRKKQKSMTKGHTDTENNGAEAALTEVLVKDNPETEAVRLSKTRGTSRRRKKQKSMIKGHADIENNGAEAALAEVLMNDNPEIEALSLPKTGSTSRGRKKQKSVTKGHTDTESNGAEAALTEVLVKDNPEIDAVRVSKTGSTSRGRKKQTKEAVTDNPEIEAVRFSATGSTAQRRRKHKGDSRKSKGGSRKRSNKLSNIVSPLERVENQSNQRIMSDTEPLTPEAEVAFREETSRVSEALVSETPSQNSEDLPLMMWFGGKKPRLTVQDSGIAIDKAIKPCRHEGNSTKSPAIASEHPTGPEKDNNLPFTKCFPIWTTIESMEVFQKMPQKPHFKPLWETKESSREGAAIGHMVTFANVTESATKIQMDDPENTIEGHLETLSELEAHGFEVGPIRDRLNQFVLMKEEKRKLVGKLQEVRTELEERSIESSKIDEEVEELDKKIEELQEKLKSAKLGGGKIDSDIAAMESEFDVTFQEVEKARRDFEKLVAAPWFS